MIPNRNASERTLEAFRVYVFALWMVKLLIDPLEELSGLPHSAWEPIGYLVLLGRQAGRVLIDENFLFFVRWGAFSALFLSVALGRFKRARFFFQLFAGVLLIHYQATVRSLGEVNHTETTLIYPVLALIAFDAVTVFRKEKDHSIPFGFPIVLTMIAICCSYSFAGAHRLIMEGVSNFQSGIMTYWCVWRGLDTSYFEMKFGAYVLTVPWLRHAMEIGFPIVTLLEAAGLFSLVSRKFKYVFLISMAGFHIGVVLMMGILFWEPIALYVTFFDLERVFGKREVSADEITNREAEGVVLTEPGDDREMVAVGHVDARD